MSGTWLSAVFSPQQLLEQSLTGYFWLLLEAMGARQAAAGKWQQATFARATMKNSLCCCGNMVEWVCRYPEGDLAFAPSKCTEQARGH